MQVPPARRRRRRKSSVRMHSHAQLEISRALDALVHELAYIPMHESQRREVARAVLSIEALSFALARVLDDYDTDAP